MPEIKLERVEREIIEIDVEGASPLIPHKWSEKSLRMMRESQSGTKAKAKHTAKIPQEEAEAALYRLPDGQPAMPSTAFKAAMVGAARLFQGVTMTALKAAVFVHGDGPDQLVPVYGEMTLREDTPRNATGVADLRYRYSFWPWRATLQIEYLTALVDKESVVALVDAAGNGGVGDWRPSAPKSLTGTFGRFRVSTM